MSEGIYIEGMEMPTDCALLLKIFPDGRVGVPIHLNWAGTMVVNDAKAVSVPPHGRLIEESKVLDIVSAWCPDDDGSVCKMGDLREMLDEIEALPTIIPTEEASDVYC